MPTRWGPRSAALAGLLFVLVPLNGGCLVSNHLPAPGETLTLTEPEHDRTYHLYIPTRYQQGRPTSLMVTCHGSAPWDWARAQLDEWKGLGEQKNFIVAAPELVSSQAALPATAADQVRRQHEDEQAILSMVRMIRAARTINPDRIFITGWSSGSWATLYVGLRNPEVFRAISVRQGTFNPAYVETCGPFIDRYQPIQILFGHMDPLDNSQEMIAWLRSHDLSPTIRERSGFHRRDPQPVYAFFADVVRRRPLVRIRVREDADDPMLVEFNLYSSFEPEQYLWDFGDARRSSEARPQHRYAEPGVYLVKVAAWGPGDRPHVRQVQLQVPRIRLGAPVPDPEPPDS